MVYESSRIEIVVKALQKQCSYGAEPKQLFGVRATVVLSRTGALLQRKKHSSPRKAISSGFDNSYQDQVGINQKFPSVVYRQFRPNY